jgi:hypothetical protein
MRNPGQERRFGDEEQPLHQDVKVGVEDDARGGVQAWADGKQELPIYHILSDCPRCPDDRTRLTFFVTG